MNGNLAFGAGSFYLVEISPTAADRTNVTGTATLSGAVLASFAPGSYIARQYMILSAAGGLGGATFASLGGIPAGFAADLSYGANDVFLNLSAALGLSSALSRNERNVANAINGYFNNGRALPPNFYALFGLTGANLATALTQLSGEAATGAQYGAFQLTNQFFSMMLDPLVYGGAGMVGGGGAGFAPGGGPLRLAAEETQAPEIALAYAMALKAPPAPAVLPERRWSVWAGGFGGTNRTQGDPVGVGSHDVSARAGGYAGGLDYRIGAGTTVGLALAGGFTNWSLANGLGGGNSDAFQAALYGVTRFGPAYLAGALAFAEHWMATDRHAFLRDHLTARFDAESWGGRLEGGWRFATVLGGIAPYAAVQAQSFRTPAYSETDATGGGFGLAYNARNASDTRSELGARFDHKLPLADMALLALHARAAWAHDWVSDPALTAAFQTLPGASFIVNGAAPVPNSALLSAGGELRFLNGWALGARFDGEFANRAETYAGTGTLRYAW
ncbi:MAG TPA: autotransporter outer membrane beta-barrel domain-containing protein [Rhodoplanes sp.]|nr:autotransporter outer membrane beta-barrel domain-containing protein [Rhodoplanes sp.]